MNTASDSSVDVSEAVSPVVSTGTSPVSSPVISPNSFASLYESAAMGISLTFPTEWNDRYYINEGSDYISVSCKAVHDDASNMGGWLFSIVRLTGELITEEDIGQSPAPTKYLMHGNGYTYCVQMPSDVQYPSDNEELSKEYGDLSGKKADVYQSLALSGDQRPEAKNEGFKVVGTSFFTVEIPIDWELKVKENALLTWSFYNGNILMGVIAKTAALEGAPYVDGMIRETAIKDNENRRYAQVVFCSGDESTMDKIIDSFSFTGGYYTVADLKSAAELYIYYGGEKLFGKIDDIEIDRGNSAVVHATIMDFDYSSNTFQPTVNTSSKTFVIDSIHIAPLVEPDYKLLGTYEMHPLGTYTRADERFFKNYPDYKNYYYDFIVDKAGVLQIVLGHYIP